MGCDRETCARGEENIISIKNRVVFQFSFILGLCITFVCLLCNKRFENILIRTFMLEKIFSFGCFTGVFLFCVFVFKD